MRKYLETDSSLNEIKYCIGNCIGPILEYCFACSSRLYHCPGDLLLFTITSTCMWPCKSISRAGFYILMISDIILHRSSMQPGENGSRRPKCRNVGSRVICDFSVMLIISTVRVASTCLNNHLVLNVWENQNIV